MSLLEYAKAVREQSTRQARKSLLAFIQFVWWEPQPLAIGRHTRELCARLDRAVDDYIAGRSTYLDVAIPVRHGKSQIVSRAFPAYFLGRLSKEQPDVILSGYGADLVQGFSRDVKRIIVSDAYQRVFPGIAPEYGSNSAESWSIQGSTGKVTAAGLDGAITGKGGDLIIVDDYFRNREDALSDKVRQKTWEAFQANVITRRGPTSIVIVCASRWHIDDVSGRIRQEEERNPEFPRFERISFPATDPVTKERLFPERYSEAWYRDQYAILGRAIASALLDSDPIPEGGNRFAVGSIIIHENLDGWPTIREVRFWDVASTAADRKNGDPDYTVGIRGGATKQGPVPSLWVRSSVYCKQESGPRNALIKATAREDGPGVAQMMEAFGAYKDAASEVKSSLMGQVVVHGVRAPGDKEAKASPLAPIIEARNLHILRDPGTDLLIKQLTEFPNGSHDDFVDALAGLHWSINRPMSSFA